MNTSDILNLVAGLLQFAVAGYALRLNYVLGPRRAGWSLFYTFSLLALLHQMKTEAFENSTMSVEALYAVVSLLLLTGMIHLETVFKERLRREQAELLLRKELETEVHNKTIYLTRAIEGLEAEIQERKRVEVEMEVHIQLLRASKQAGWTAFNIDHNTEPTLTTRR